MSFDFYSPFMRAVITAADGTRFPLWTDLNENTDFGANDIREQASLARDEYTPHALSYVTEISVELDLGMIPKIEVTLNPPLEEARRLLNSRVLEWTTSTIEVEFGYTSGGEPIIAGPFSGIILQPQVTLGTSASITITAQGTAGFALERTQSTSTYRGTRQQIIGLILNGPNAKQKRKILLDDKPVSDAVRQFPVPQESLNTSNRLLTAGFGANLAQTVTGNLQPLANKNATYWRRYFNEVIEVSQGNVSDWVMIWRLVREARCVMVLRGDTLRVFPTDTWLTARPKRSLRFHNYPSNEFGPFNQTFPILNVSSDQMAVFLPNAVRGYVLRDVGSKSGSVETSIENDSEVKTPRTGTGDAGRGADENDPGPDADTGDGLGTWSGNPENNQARAQAQAAVESAQTGLGLQLEIETLLDPELFPGTTVSVEGISARHDGTFAVLSSNYRIGTAGATMTLKVISNVGSLGALSGGFDALNLNEQTQDLQASQLAQSEQNNPRPAGPVNSWGGPVGDVTEVNEDGRVRSYNTAEQSERFQSRIRNVAGRYAPGVNINSLSDNLNF
jgi:hypothetical protein